MEATSSGTKRSRWKDASRVSDDAHDDGRVLDDEQKSGVTREEDVEESGVKEIEEAHEERMHTPDEPEELKFDDAFETGELSSGPASDFKDPAEDEDEDDWTHSEMEEYEYFLKLIDDAVRKKSEAIRAKRPEKGKENQKFNEPAKRKVLTSQNLHRLANIQLTQRYQRGIMTRSFRRRRRAKETLSKRYEVC